MRMVMTSGQDEGYAALLISIIKGVNRDVAFQILSGECPVSRRNTSWTEDDYEKILEMKSRGMKWDEIGEVMGATGCACAMMFHRYQKKKMEKATILKGHTAKGGASHDH